MKEHWQILCLLLLLILIPFISANQYYSIAVSLDNNITTILSTSTDCLGVIEDSSRDIVLADSSYQDYNATYDLFFLNTSGNFSSSCLSQLSITMDDLEDVFPSCLTNCSIYSLPNCPCAEIYVSILAETLYNLQVSDVFLANESCSSLLNDNSSPYILDNTYNDYNQRVFVNLSSPLTPECLSNITATSHTTFPISSNCFQGCSIFSYDNCLCTLPIYLAIPMNSLNITQQPCFLSDVLQLQSPPETYELMYQNDYIGQFPNGISFTCLIALNQTTKFLTNLKIPAVCAQSCSPVRSSRCRCTIPLYASIPDQENINLTSILTSNSSACSDSQILIPSQDIFVPNRSYVAYETDTFIYIPNTLSDACLTALGTDITLVSSISADCMSSCSQPISSIVDTTSYILPFPTQSLCPCQNSYFTQFNVSFIIPREQYRDQAFLALSESSSVIDIPRWGCLYDDSTVGCTTQPSSYLCSPSDAQPVIATYSTNQYNVTIIYYAFRNIGCSFTEWQTWMPYNTTVVEKVMIIPGKNISECYDITSNTFLSCSECNLMPCGLDEYCTANSSCLFGTCDLHLHRCISYSIHQTTLSVMVIIIITLSYFFF